MNAKLTLNSLNQFNSNHVGLLQTKKVARLKLSNRVALNTYHRYTPKQKQQIISNKLCNKELYGIYTIRKLHCGGKWLKDNIVDGTITIAKQVYIISWLDILPIDAYKEVALELSLRSPKHKDSISKEYPKCYCLVSRFIDN